MTADYTQGVRQAKEKNAYEVKYGTDDFNNALASLGITFGKENESAVDTLNKRGMAVYQNNPDGSANVVNPTTFSPTDDMTNFTWSNNLQNPGAPDPNQGRGGYEINQLQKDQGLRAEAVQRSKMQPLEQSAMNLKQFTNPTGGFNPANPGAYTGDVSQLGTAESGLLGKQTSALQNYRNTGQQLAQNRSQEINQIAQGAALTGQKTLDQNFVNQYQKELNTDFIKGVT